MKNLQQMLDSDMGDVIDWLSNNADKYYLVPKDFMEDFDKECVIEFTEAINDGAPRGEMLDNMDLNETMLFALSGIVEEK